MNKQQFKATIHAARNTVWHVLWADGLYNEWTSVFAPGSSAQSDWKEGSEIIFGDGKGNGMYAIIAKKDEPEYMAFKHIGEIKDGVKQPPGSWAGSLETYRLTESEGKTELLVEMDVDDAWLEYFLKTWPLALEKIRSLSESADIKKITVEAIVNAPAEKVWRLWTEPQHIMQWNNASDDWCTPAATNDLKTGGNFNYRMEAKDGSFGFDFTGKYDAVKNQELIAYTMDDGRKAEIGFTSSGNSTTVKEVFEAETMHPFELQRMGWQAILNNFKKYTESH